MSEKSYVGMGFSVCPVCATKHSEVVLLDQRMRMSLKRDNFMGFEMCENDKKLKNAGFIALIEVKNKPMNFSDADRTGVVAHMKTEAFINTFGYRPPEMGAVYVEAGFVQKLRENVNADVPTV